MTSSAMESTVGGTTSPSILAVSALTTSSSLVDCMTGRSAGLAPFDDKARIGADLTIHIRIVGSVAHQPADFGIMTLRVCRGDLVKRRQVDQLNTPADEQEAAADEESVRPLKRKR